MFVIKYSLEGKLKLFKFLVNIRLDWSGILDNKIYELLKTYFGYDSFRSGQEEIIDNILRKRDCMSVMPTGAGKSLCYQIPAVYFSGITLVISPLISLMKDQVYDLNQIGIRAAYINSSLNERQVEKALINAKNSVYKIIYVAPERLNTARFLNFASKAQISFIAIDEAHCVSQWGHDFRRSYLRIPEFMGKLIKRPVIAAFTATATDSIKKDIIDKLKLDNPFMITTGFDRKNLYFSVFKPLDKTTFILKYIFKNLDKCGIIYCGTRAKVDDLTKILKIKGINAERYHAGLSDEERNKNQDDFIFDRIKVMVATNAFGMGIDKSNVSYVINYNMPMNIEQYYQEAGRAGRDGRKADCILLYSKSDVNLCKFLLNSKIENATDCTEEDRERLRELEEEKLKMMTFYSTTKYCLRHFILKYFGEKSRYNCNNCGNCDSIRYEDIIGLAPVPSQIKSVNKKDIDYDLLRKFKEKRLSIAKTQSVPAYVIFSDAVLEEMASLKPKTLRAMRDINGIGKLKLEKYGQIFLDIIFNHEDLFD